MPKKTILPGYPRIAHSIPPLWLAAFTCIIPEYPSCYTKYMNLSNTFEEFYRKVSSSSHSTWKGSKKHLFIQSHENSPFLVKKRTASSKPCRHIREHTSVDGGIRHTVSRYIFLAVNRIDVPATSNPNKLKWKCDRLTVNDKSIIVSLKKCDTTNKMKLWTCGLSSELWNNCGI